MLPAKRRQVGQQGISNRFAAATGGIQRAAEIDGVPQRDGSRDQGSRHGKDLKARMAARTTNSGSDETPVFGHLLTRSAASHWKAGWFVVKA